MLFRRSDIGPDRAEIDQAYDRGLAVSLANVDQFARERGLTADEHAAAREEVRDRLDSWRAYQVWQHERSRP